MKLYFLDTIINIHTDCCVPLHDQVLPCAKFLPLHVTVKSHKNLRYFGWQWRSIVWERWLQFICAMSVAGIYRVSNHILKNNKTAQIVCDFHNSTDQDVVSGGISIIWCQLHPSQGMKITFDSFSSMSLVHTSYMWALLFQLNHSPMGDGNPRNFEITMH